MTTERSTQSRNEKPVSIAAAGRRNKIRQVLRRMQRPASPHRRRFSNWSGGPRPEMAPRWIRIARREN
jgi:hypothetical protein